LLKLLVFGEEEAGAYLITQHRFTTQVSDTGRVGIRISFLIQVVNYGFSPEFLKPSFDWVIGGYLS
jgi:hypothetical protein